MDIELMIMEILEANGELSTKEICEKNNHEYGLNAISSHLRRMTEQGLLTREEALDGKYRYSINKKGAT